MTLLFLKEMDELIKKAEFTEERKGKYRKWVANAKAARNAGSLNYAMNQYDKAEELLTWYTFAPMLRMSIEQRNSTVNKLLNPLVASDVVVSNPRLYFEKMLLPSESYYGNIAANHPVKYIREEIEDHRKREILLEKHTHVDLLMETGELVIPIEAKFTSDIDYQTTYSCTRNQIVRTIDVSIEAAKRAQPPKKALFLLCVPKNLYNQGRYYYYKMKDYGNLENLKHDLPYQTASFELYFHSAHVIFWEDVASTIIRNAIEWRLFGSDELEALNVFYDERLIKLSLQ